MSNSSTHRQRWGTMLWLLMVGVLLALAREFGEDLRFLSHGLFASLMLFVVVASLRELMKLPRPDPRRKESIVVLTMSGLMLVFALWHMW